MKFELTEVIAEKSDININGIRYGESHTFKQWMNACVVLVHADTPQSHIEQLYQAMCQIAQGPCLISSHELRFFVIQPALAVRVLTFWNRIISKVSSFLRRLLNLFYSSV